MRVRNVLFSILALTLIFALTGLDAPDVAMAQNTSAFVVDGKREDWGGGYRDPWYDVVPDTNSTADIGLYDYGWGEYGRVDGGERRELFAFILHFVAPPFLGSEPTTMELFFDLSMDETFGELTPPWSEFRADYCVGVTGQDGGLTTEFHRRYVGGQWQATSGSDITELEIALSGHWLEGAVPWSALGNPKAPVDPDKYLPFRFAFRVSQGKFHDYVPDPEEGVIEEGLTIVVPQSWGRIKER